MEKIPKKLSDNQSKILNEIQNAGESGIWLRELSRRTKIPKSTLWYWFKNYKNEMFKNVEILKQVPTTTQKSYIILFRMEKRFRK